MSHFATCASALFVLARSASADDIVRSPDVDPIGMLGIARHTEVFGDATYEHADNSDAIALVLGGRLAIGDLGFVEGRVPLGYGQQASALAFGNVTLAGGVLPDERLVALALRISAPTSPRAGDGMMSVLALSAPRLADPELFLSHTTSAEVVADWRWRGDASWVQVEAGAAGWWQPGDFLPVLRGTAAGGVHVEHWLELTASFVTRVRIEHAPEHFVHSLMLGIVAHDSHGQATLRLEVPIDDSARNVNRFVVGLELRGP